MVIVVATMVAINVGLRQSCSNKNNGYNQCRIKTWALRAAAPGASASWKLR